MPANIYDQHRAAFANVSAFVVLLNTGERVATVALKFPKDGSGRLYAYVHWFGERMVRGFASGGGYDKSSAAVSCAVHKMDWKTTDKTITNMGELRATFIRELAKDDGRDWARRLEDAGFIVMRAV